MIVEVYGVKIIINLKRVKKRYCRDTRKRDVVFKVLKASRCIQEGDSEIEKRTECLFDLIILFI